MMAYILSLKSCTYDDFDKIRMPFVSLSDSSRLSIPAPYILIPASGKDGVSSMATDGYRCNWGSWTSVYCLRIFSLSSD